MRVSDEVTLIQPFKSMGLTLVGLILFGVVWVVTIATLLTIGIHTLTGVALILSCLWVVQIALFLKEKFIFWPLFMGHYYRIPKGFNSDHVKWLRDSLGDNYFVLLNFRKEICEIKSSETEFILFKYQSQVVMFKLRFSD